MYENMKYIVQKKSRKLCRNMKFQFNVSVKADTTYKLMK